MPDTPQPLQRLLDRLQQLISAATDTLEQDIGRVADWRETMERLLTRYHTAAYLAGQDSETLAGDDRKTLEQLISAQLEFLNNFTLEIQEADEFKAGWRNRAEMYADAIQVPYWKGATKVLPLPAMPGEGTQCLTRCRCTWEVVPVDEERGDYDAYWRLTSAEHCQTCLQRASEWAPLQIRGGRLV